MEGSQGLEIVQQHDCVIKHPEVDRMRTPNNQNVINFVLDSDSFKYDTTYIHLTHNNQVPLPPSSLKFSKISRLQHQECEEQFNCIIYAPCTKQVGSGQLKKVPTFT